MYIYDESLSEGSTLRWSYPCRYQSVYRRKDIESTRDFLSRPCEVKTYKSPEILEHRSPEKPVIADSAAGPNDSNVHTMGLRGHCLAYCQRDRADFISSVRNLCHLALGMFIYKLNYFFFDSKVVFFRFNGEILHTSGKCSGDASSSSQRVNHPSGCSHARFSPGSLSAMRY